MRYGYIFNGSRKTHILQTSVSTFLITHSILMFFINWALYILPALMFGIKDRRMLDDVFSGTAMLPEYFLYSFHETWKE